MLAIGVAVWPRGRVLRGRVAVWPQWPCGRVAVWRRSCGLRAAVGGRVGWPCQCLCCSVSG